MNEKEKQANHEALQQMGETIEATIEAQREAQMKKCECGHQLYQHDGEHWHSQCNVSGCSCQKFITTTTKNMWSHSICQECNNRLRLNPQPIRTTLRNLGSIGVRALYRVFGQTEPQLKEICCSCGKTHTGGIWYHGNPAMFLCKGQHEQ